MYILNVIDFTYNEVYVADEDNLYFYVKQLKAPFLDFKIKKFKGFHYYKENRVVYCENLEIMNKVANKFINKKIRSEKLRIADAERKIKVYEETRNVFK